MATSYDLFYKICFLILHSVLTVSSNLLPLRKITHCIFIELNKNKAFAMTYVWPDKSIFLDDGVNASFVFIMFLKHGVFDCLVVRR